MTSLRAAYTEHRLRIYREGTEQPLVTLVAEQVHRNAANAPIGHVRGGLPYKSGRAYRCRTRVT